MNSTVSKLAASWILFILSSLFSTSSCEPVQLCNEDYGDWFRRISTVGDGIGVLTRAPYPREITSNPLSLERYTTPIYDDYKYYSSSSIDETVVKMLIIVGVFILVAIICGCKYFVCGGNDVCGSITDTSEPLLHPPPRSSRYGSENQFTSSTAPYNNGNQLISTISTSNRIPFVTPAIHTTRANSFVSEPFREPTVSINSPRVNYVPSSNSTQSANNTRMPTSDQPPDYSMVVIDDLTQQHPQFPEVQLREVLDSPPPSYKENTFQN